MGMGEWGKITTFRELFDGTALLLRESREKVDGRCEKWRVCMRWRRAADRVEGRRYEPNTPVLLVKDTNYMNLLHSLAF